MVKKNIRLWLSEESIDILENYAYFHSTTIDDIADGAVQMFPFYEKRSQQIREMKEKF